MDGRGHIGEGGGVQYFVDPAHLLGGQNALGDQQDLGPLAGVKLHGQGDQCEKRRGGKEGQTDPGDGFAHLPQAAHEEKTGHKDDRPQPTAQLHRGHHGRAPDQGCVVLLILQGVAGFVGGNANGGQTGTAIDIRAETKNLAAGVVVIAEKAVDLLHLHFVETVGVQNTPGRLSPGDPPGAGDFGILLKCALDPHLRPQPQKQGGQADENI